MSERQLRLSARDILTSSATLIGLALAALSFLAGFGPHGSHAVAIASIILIVGVSSFVAGILFSLATDWFGQRFWKYATGTYAGGWVAIGLLIAQLALELGYGIDLFAIPNIPLSSDQVTLAVSVVLTATTSVVTATVAYVAGGERLRKALREILGTNVPAAHKPALPDPRLEFLDEAISLEKQIRALATQSSIADAERAPLSQLLVRLSQKNVIPEDTIQMVNLVWRARNLVVHGAFVPNDTLEYAGWAASLVRERFNQIMHKKTGTS